MRLTLEELVVLAKGIAKNRNMELKMVYSTFSSSNFGWRVVIEKRDLNSESMLIFSNIYQTLKDALIAEIKSYTKTGVKYEDA